MKLRISPKTGVSGNTLTATLFSTVIIGFVLASYMTLVSSLNYKNMRSQAWNSAISVIEAGIEEALTHLNVNDVTNLMADDWTLLSNGDYFKSRPLGGGSRFEVTITPDNNPIVVSRGFVPVPENNIRFYRHYFATTGLNGEETAVSTPVRRTVKVTTARRGMFVKAMVAKELIDMNGFNVETDSFDSSNPAHSTFGRYDPTKRLDNGDVASNTNIINSVDVGNAKIRGRVSTGPGGTVELGDNGAVGSATWHAAGNIGIQPGYFKDDMNVSFPVVEDPDMGSAFTPGPDTAVLTNYNVATAEQISTTFPTLYTGTVVTNTRSVTSSTYPDPVPPGGVSTEVQTTFTTSRTYPAAGTYVGPVVTRVETTGKLVDRGTWYDYNAITGQIYSYTAVTYTYWTTTTNITTATNSYAYVLEDGNYTLSSLSMSGSDQMLVTGDAVLLVNGNIDLSGSSSITIAPGASLTLYMAGANASLRGNGVINQTGYAHNFMYYGLPSNTYLSLGGNAEILAVIYAPDAHFRLFGSGSTEFDFMGASITRSVTMNGHFKFHYDEYLRGWGPNGKWVVTSWDEVDNSF